MDRGTQQTARVLVIAATVLASGPVWTAHAAPWLSPAAQERLSADWVKDVASAFRTEQAKELFMNSPFGSPQSSILGLLNDAAEALQDGQGEYAKDLIRHALGILDDGVEHGWYSPSDVRPIKRMILKKARQGFRDAGVGEATARPRASRQPALEGPEQERLFGGRDDYELYGGEGDRWTGYTQNRPLGLTERLDDTRTPSRFEDEQAYRDRQRKPGGRQGREEMSRRPSASRSATDTRREGAERQAEREAALFREDLPLSDEWYGLGPQEQEQRERSTQRSRAPRGAYGQDMYGGPQDQRAAQRPVAPRRSEREAEREAALFREDLPLSEEWYGLGPQEPQREGRTSQRLGGPPHDRSEPEGRGQERFHR